jgi:hypothetical protein
MTNLTSLPGEFKFTIDIKRAATGLTETVEMIGKIVDPADLPATLETPVNLSKEP